MMRKKKTIKMLLTMLVMMVAFFVAGVTSEAAAVSGLKQIDASETSVKVEYSTVSGYKYYGYEIASDSDFKNVVKTGYDSSEKSTDTSYIYGLQQGSTYYVRIGCGTTYKNCYSNWSNAIDVVTTPGTLSDVKFTDANDNSATIQFSAQGATQYNIYDGYSEQLVGTTSSTQYTINMSGASSNYYKVEAVRTSSLGYVTATYTKTIEVNMLTTKISKDDFGVQSVLSNINKISVAALFSGSGFEVEMTNAGGSTYSITGSVNKSFTSTGASTNYFDYKENKYLKYRVRAFVNTSDGTIYGDWSDYRAFCEMNGKYTRGSKKVKFTWGKMNGTGKIKVQVSTKKASKYKTFKTLKGTAKNVTVNKYGKASLKKNKSYYFQITPMVKIDGKYVASDYYLQQQIKLK